MICIFHIIINTILYFYIKCLDKAKNNKILTFKLSKSAIILSMLYCFNSIFLTYSYSVT